MARTVVVTTSILYQMFLAFNCKSKKSFFKFSGNKWLIYAVLISFGLHLALLYSPLNSIFGFAYLGIYEWIEIIALAFAGFVIMEIVKRFLDK